MIATHDRVIIADFIRGFILASVITATIILGVKDVINAEAVTGILGAVIGAVGATGAASVGGRIKEREMENGRQAD